MKYQMNRYRHPWRRRVRQFLRDYCGGPYWINGTRESDSLADTLEHECAYLYVRGNRWRLAAYVTMALWLFTLWLHATGRLGAPLP